MTKHAQVLAAELARLSISDPVTCAELCVHSVLRALHYSTGDERERIAAEMVTLTNGGAVLVLADFAERALEEEA